MTDIIKSEGIMTLAEYAMFQNRFEDALNLFKKLDTYQAAYNISQV